MDDLILKKIETKSRRKFLMNSLFLVTGFLPGCAHYAMTKAMLMGGSTSDKEVDPEIDEVAKYLKYTSNRVPENLSTNAESCKNCAHYTATSGHEQFGRCNLIPSGLVQERGWCIAWVISNEI